MSEFLLELFSEEIPARMQAKAADDLQSLIEKGLNDAGLTFSSVENFSTPRRLGVVVQGLPLQTEARETEKRGPRVGSPENVVQAFLKANNLTDVAQLEARAGDKGEFYFLIEKLAGQNTADVLPQIILQAIKTMPWPKSMRWAHGSFMWPRPLQAINAVFNGNVVQGTLDMGGNMHIAFGNTSFGHRFLSNSAPINIQNFAQYKTELAKNFVVISRAERRELILQKANALAAEKGLALIDDNGLLEEIVGLVECPEPMLVPIPTEFMALPPEVLQTSMRVHQRYMSLQDSAGKFAPYFIVVANMNADSAARVANIKNGNSRVLRARLSDARFFWEQDQKKTLEQHNEKLATITFHEKIGSMQARVERITAIAKNVAEQTGADVTQVGRAASLCKADLVTGMVDEFPELQGIMGAYYATQQKEPADVANAIKDHYKPAGAADSVPTAPASVALALAEKLDTLISLFSIGEKPTGSKDPFALRRAALGVIRIVLENKLKDFNLLYTLLNVTNGNSDVAYEVSEFILKRMDIILKESFGDNISKAVCESTIFNDKGKMSVRGIFGMYQIAESLQQIDTNLLALYKRVKGKIEKKGYVPAMTPQQIAKLLEISQYDSMYGATETYLFGLTNNAVTHELATLLESNVAERDEPTAKALETWFNNINDFALLERLL